MNETSLGPEQKRARVEKFPGLDEAVLSFVRKCRDNNCIVTGPSVQAAAQRFSVSILKEMDPPQPAENFRASNGWLDNFKARNKIIARTLEGERASVPMDTVQDFKNKLPTLLADNDPKDVYNGDEVTSTTNRLLERL